MNNILIVIGGNLLLAAHLCYEKRGRPTASLITKSILSVLFVMAALWQSHGIADYSRYIIVGLGLCLIGDVCLALPGERIFQAGLVAFLLGMFFTFLVFWCLRNFLSGFLREHSSFWASACSYFFGYAPT